MTEYHEEDFPVPIVVLDKLGIKPLKMNNQAYWVLSCPFHKNGFECHPSFNLHSVTGHFLCFTCGAKGRNIIDFYIKVTNQDFFTALEVLGAWR